METRAGLVEAFTRPDTTGIGILTNWPYFVIDIDGEEGARAWKEIAGEDYIPDRWVAQTSRGLHIWYADERTIRGSRKLGEKLDMKGNGGYVAAPPSLHPSGFVYKWLMAPGNLPPIEAPRRLLSLLEEQDALAQQRIIANEHSRRIHHEPLEDGKFWASFVSLKGPIARLRSSTEGERNNVLHWAAMAILRDGARDEELNELYDAAIECGLTRVEARRTIRSAQKAVARG
jgi:hypothetical protein